MQQGSFQKLENPYWKAIEQESGRLVIHPAPSSSKHVVERFRQCCFDIRGAEIHSLGKEDVSRSDTRHLFTFPRSSDKHSNPDLVRYTPDFQNGGDRGPLAIWLPVLAHQGACKQSCVRWCEDGCGPLGISSFADAGWPLHLVLSDISLDVQVPHLADIVTNGEEEEIADDDRATLHQENAPTDKSYDLSCTIDTSSLGALGRERVTLPDELGLYRSIKQFPPLAEKLRLASVDGASGCCFSVHRPRNSPEYSMSTTCTAGRVSLACAGRILPNASPLSSL